MSEDKGNSYYGITFWGLLQVMFIGLKLAGVIDWPWWQVFLPIIIECAVVIVVFVVAIAIALKD